MSWHLVHNGTKIPYWLGLLIGLDQFLGCFIPGHDIDKTISHRLGVKRYRLALNQKLFGEQAAFYSDGKPKPWRSLYPGVQAAIRNTRIPRRYLLQWLIDSTLEKIDPDHSPKSVGY